MNLLSGLPSAWEAFFLVFCRVGTMMLVAPIFGSRGTTPQVRVFLSLTVALVMAPVVAAPGVVIPGDLGTFVGRIAREALIGGLVGFVVLMVFTALEGAGHIVGLQMGFSLANIINPLTSTNASLIDQFYSLVATLVFLTIDGHHIVLLGIERTFQIVPIDNTGSILPPRDLIFGLGREIFATASRMALPVLTALLLTDVALAMVARSVPQLNVFVVGMPAKIVVGFVMLIVTVPAVAYIMAKSFGDIVAILVSFVRGMGPV
jgi:flagellar biosynthetic protein FliR